MGLITQINTVNTGNTILNNAIRATSQYNNTATSLLSEFSAWEASVPDADLDQATQQEISGLKSTTIASIRATLSALDTALANL